MKTFEQIFDKALRQATDDAMHDPVGECDVCHWIITRAEKFVMDIYKTAGGFGCIRCVLTGRVAPWKP